MNRSFMLCVLSAWTLATSVHSAPFEELAGVAVFEAEDFATNLSPRSAHDWVVTNVVGGFSGKGYVEVLPDVGANLSANWLSLSPELQYPGEFPGAGTRYVWLRAFASNDVSDSVHAGLDNVTNTGHGITLIGGQYGAWFWITNRIGALPRPTVTGGAGSHTFQLWMREDGMRVDRVLLTTNPDLLPQLGNAWHIPDNVEPGIPSMRIPVTGIGSNTAVVIYSGNQFQGGGNAADQAQTGSRVYYKRSTDSDWTIAPMLFHSTSGNNKYYSATIPAGSFAPGDTVQYYLRIGYTDRLPTFLCGNDSFSLETELESVAQVDPFSYDVEWPLNPSGAYLAITNIAAEGVIEARIYTNSGHLQLVGPDLNGSALANSIPIAPSMIRVGGEWHQIGQVLSAIALSNGLELVQRVAATSVVSRLTFLTEGVMRYEVVHFGGLPVQESLVQVPSDASEHFYGFGEKFNDFDQAGHRVRMMTRDVAGAKGDNSYKVVPWFLSTRGYGFHLDSSAESFFDMRAQAADRYSVECLFPVLKFNVVYGPKLTTALTRYTGYTGRTPLPPPWVFAPWMSTDIWRNGGEVRYAITTYRQHNIAGSVFVYDSPWEIGYNDFNWNLTQWGNSGNYAGTNWPGFASSLDMMNFLRANGFKAVLWMTPFINTTSVSDGVGGQNTGQAANYAAGAANNYFVRASAGGPPLSVNWWKGTGSPVDFTNPNAAAWLANQLSNVVALSGGVVGGFKTDDGESGSSDSNIYIPANAVYSDGRTGLEMANGYAVDYHRTVWNVLGSNGVLFARSGFTGTQRYPVGWAGDNEPNFGVNGLPGVVVAGQSSAMSGYALWSHDVGGYQDSNWSSTPENLFMRWTQFGALTPIMQMHRKVDLNRQYPWSFGAVALSNYVHYADFHTALFPYIYTYAKAAEYTGLPVMRPLVLMNQSDPNTYGLQHTYLFGDELLYAAIITNVAVSRNVYLPPGNWCDYFTHQVHAGGQNILWSNPDQAEMPLFVRQGALIPMLPTGVKTLCDAAYVGNTNLATWDDGALEFLVYPATNSAFTVYDGTTLQCQSNGTVVTLALTSIPRPVTLRVLAAAPFSVERDGVTLPSYTNAAQFAQASVGWHVAPPFVLVKLEHAGGASQIAFGPDSVGDGVSDSWRAHYFSGSGEGTNNESCAECDADGDGLGNRDEYHAGTNPQNTNSTLRIQELNGQTRELVWGTVAGRYYRLRATTNMLEPSVALSGVIQATGPEASYIDTNAVPDRFYRVELLP